MRGLCIAGSGRAARPFLTHLRAGGHSVTSYGGAGSDNGAGASAVATALRTLILVPRDIAEAEALLFETEGFAKSARDLNRIIIAATLSPRYVRALRGRIAARIALIDAPYCGSLRAAEEARLCFFLGGRADDVAPLMPLFELLGRKAIRMGGFGSAMAAKVMNDFLAASSTAMTRIALDWAEAQGIDEAKMLGLAEATLDRQTLMPGYDMVDFVNSGPGGDECITTLVKEVESALDNALASAHLTPPRALEELFRNMKSRALH